MTTMTKITKDTKPTYHNAHVQPREITTLTEFNHRENGINRSHVRTLVQTLRNTGRLEPVLLWKDRRDPTVPRLVLLDGAHRLAAYGALNGLGRGHNRGVPAKIAECDPKAASLLALSGNTRDSLPLTTNERTDAAWQLVRHETITFSKAEIARASGVSPRTVSNMRKRFRELTDVGTTPNGRWWIDRWGNDRTDTFDLNDLDKNAKVKALTAALQGPLGGWKRESEEVLALALENVFGRRLRGIVEFLYGADEDFLDLPVGVDTGATCGDEREVLECDF
jgi:hypothetical protein